jgi:predicted DNA-binding transcriptional regulator YafY
MRADRLVALALLLQARGKMTAAGLAAELEVSVRTVYRDLMALSTAGVPVVTEAGPNGGCYLIGGYQFPLRGLSPDAAEAFLILGIPPVLRDLGLPEAHFATRSSTHSSPSPGASSTPLVHLDMPAWFRVADSAEKVPCLRPAARALRDGRALEVEYKDRPRVVLPLGIVNKSGTWYLVGEVAGKDGPAVFRVGRMTAARVLPQPAVRPAGFDLVAFWERWSAAFEASLPRVEVRLRASPAALAAFPEVFGDGARPALEAAGPPDGGGWRAVTLTFEHEVAAGHRLAGFGGQVEVLSPPAVRDWLLATASEIVNLYGLTAVRRAG